MHVLAVFISDHATRAMRLSLMHSRRLKACNAVANTFQVLPDLFGKFGEHLWLFAVMHSSAETCAFFIPAGACTCRYLISLYYVVVTIGTVGYGDVLPANSTEVFISLFIILIGLVFFGLLLGAIATSLQVCCTAVQSS